MYVIRFTNRYNLHRYMGTSYRPVKTLRSARKFDNRDDAANVITLMSETYMISPKLLDTAIILDMESVSSSGRTSDWDIESSS